jgi:hypothetical protein
MTTLMQDTKIIDEKGVAFIITQTNKTVFRVIIPGGLGFGGDKQIGGRFYSFTAAMAFVAEWIEESKSDRGQAVVTNAEPLKIKSVPATFDGASAFALFNKMLNEYAS